MATEIVGVYCDLLRRVSVELPAIVRERIETLRLDPPVPTAKIA